MQKSVLANGLKVIYQKKPGNSVVIQVMVNIGSNYELPSERGIAHFLEHMLFEGTTKRPTNLEISNEIETIGGDFNAYTTNERTCFYIKVLKKHYSKAVEVLADILTNPLFKEEQLQKEKNIVLKEIDMIHDEPSYFQWILLQKNLYKKHPSKNPTYGSKQVIKNLTTKKVSNYFNKYYGAGNMVVSVVGDAPAWRKEIVKNFTKPRGKPVNHPKFSEPKSTKNVTVKLKKDVVNTYSVLGFKTVARSHKDAAVLDVINGILGRGQSGKMFTEIRSKRGLAYEVGTQHLADLSFGFFAIYATCDRKNLQTIKNLSLQQIANLRNVTDKEVKESKDFIEGDYLLSLEDTQKIADQILYWEHVQEYTKFNNYIKDVKKVTIQDIKRVVKKYFTKHTWAILEGK